MDTNTSPFREDYAGPLRGDALHAKKNRPDMPLELQEWLDHQPPYVYKAFPTCVYRRDAEQTVESRQAENDSQLQRYLADGWVQEPTDEAFKAARSAEILKTGELAAHRAYEDRNMSPAAQAFATAAELSTEEHLTTVPEAKRGPGRPRKTE